MVEIEIRKQISIIKECGFHPKEIILGWKEYGELIKLVQEYFPEIIYPSCIIIFMGLPVHMLGQETYIAVTSVESRS